MKKTLSLLLAMVVLFSLAGCGRKSAATSLYEKGVDLTTKMDMLAESDDYISALSTSPELNETLKQISANDYTAPKMVFEISGMDTAALPLHLLGDISLSKEVEEVVRDRLILGFASQINAKSGTTILAASSIITVNDSFLDATVKESKLYLYLYENEYGSIVSFVPKGETIVQATATIVKDEGLNQLATEDDVKKLVSETLFLPDVTVTNVPASSTKHE